MLIKMLNMINIWDQLEGWVGLGWSHNAAGATSPRACNHALAAKFQHDNDDDDEEEEEDDAVDGGGGGSGIGIGDGDDSICV